jgi:dephospho-CoA kinase
VLYKRNKNKRNKIAPNTGVIIGLTGGIGSGKSYILQSFKKLGFKVFDTDKAVHNLMKQNNEGYNKIAKLFPEAAGSKAINRSKLAKILINSKANLQKIEKILHPLVRKAQHKFSLENKKHSIVFEVPLLFENKRESYYDYIVTAIVESTIQKSRVLLRKGMTQDKFNAMVSKQVSDSIRRKKADFIIDTNGSKRATFNQIKDLIQHV